MKNEIPVKISDVRYGDKVLKFQNIYPRENSRIKSIFTKEPGTISWLKSFDKSDVFYDVGANIGIYSVFASKVTGCETYAFEPEANNFAALANNKHLNSGPEDKLLSNLHTYCLAISDEPIKFSHLLVNSTGIGDSHHDFDEDSVKTIANAKKYEVPPKLMKQGVLGVSIDWLVEHSGFPFPTHIKVDVDGWENKVYEGMIKTIQDDRLKSVFLEIDLCIKESRDLVEKMMDHGFYFSRAQLRNAVKPISEKELTNKLSGRDTDGWLMAVFFKDELYHEYFEQDFQKRLDGQPLGRIM